MRVEGMGERQEVLMDSPVVGGEPFDAFYRRHRNRLVGLAFAISGSRLGADDLVHDVMEAAYRDWDHIRERDDPAAWVRRMVVNRAVSAYRRRLSETKAVARLAIRRDVAVWPEPNANRDQLWGEVRRLPRRQAQVVALTYVEQLTMAEVAEVLGCSKESVNTHLRRARETLARRLGLEMQR
jgi:RNA polymerase sigma-70 factor (ECF subfamily)